MKKSLAFIFLLSFILLANASFAVSAQSNYTDTGYKEETTQCQDSDGDNPNIKGNIAYISNRSAYPQTFVDWCDYTYWTNKLGVDEKVGVVQEGFCEGDNAFKVLAIKCDGDSICRDGACITGASSLPRCSDSDGGKVASKKGKVDGTKGGGEDYCFDKSLEGGEGFSTPSCSGNNCFIYEFTCSSDEDFNAELISCSEGCSNGACINTQDEIPEIKKCTDSDGGEKYYTRGSTSYPGDIGGTDKCSVIPVGTTCEKLGGIADKMGYCTVEECSGKNCYITENYCRNDYPYVNSSYSCPDGCFNGACIGEKDESETEQDKDILIKNDIGDFKFSEEYFDDDCGIIFIGTDPNYDIINCNLYGAKYTHSVYGQKTSNVNIEKYLIDFSNADFINGIKSFITNKNGKVNSDEFEENNILVSSLTEGGSNSYNVHWHNGDKAIFVTAGSKEDLEDESFEKLLSAYLDKYPSKLVFEERREIAVDEKLDSLEQIVGQLLETVDKSGLSIADLTDKIGTLADKLGDGEFEKSEINNKLNELKNLLETLEDKAGLEEKDQKLLLEKIVNLIDEIAGKASSDDGRKEELICNFGCKLENTCVSAGYRNKGQYCSLDGNFVSQLEENAQCDNSFECGSNVCVSGQCVDAGLIKRILEWFRNFFG